MYKRQDDDRVALADTGLDLDMGREGCTAMADNTGRTDALDTLLIAHGSEVVGDVYKRQMKTIWSILHFPFSITANKKRTASAVLFAHFASNP